MTAGCAIRSRGLSISVSANIAEGFDCDSNAEFIRFLGFARRSASRSSRSSTWLWICAIIAQGGFDQLYRQADSTKELIGGFVRYLKTHPDLRKGR